MFAGKRTNVREQTFARTNVRNKIDIKITSEICEKTLDIV